jgi:acyl carrier protein
MQRPPADEAGPSVDSGSDVEARLAEIWSTLLGSDSVGLDDDFFMIGGNSLVAVQLIAQVRTAFGVRLPMRSIFDTPTVAGIAAKIVQLRAAVSRR